MNTMMGTYLDGQIVPDSVPSWANGVRIVMEVDVASCEPTDDQGDDPESIARWLAWYDALEPLILTAEDEQRIADARKDHRERELATWGERNEKLEQLFT